MKYAAFVLLLVVTGFMAWRELLFRFLHKPEPWRRLTTASLVLVLLISSAMLGSIHTVHGASSGSYRIDQSILKPSGALTISSTYRLHGSMSGELLVVPASSGNYRLSPANSEPPDQEAPVITLNGNASINHEAGTLYTDAGASATDNVDSTVTVLPTGSVDANTTGTYTLTYSASDAVGNAATPVTRTVMVADTIAPVITLLGSPEMDVLFNITFTDPGSSVSDGFESGLIAIVTGAVDTSVPGTYTLTYNVSDSAGNVATEVKRTVHVVDQDGPVIALNGIANVNHEAGTPYTDDGASATDNADSTVTVITTGSVDVNTPGTYTLTYSATDSEGNPATPVTRTVMVADTIGPVITLLGAAEMEVLFNATFTDPGSSVSDGFESGLIATVAGAVNTSTPGTYTLTYNVSDSAGNAATEVQRTVHVVDQDGPVITLNGDASINHEAGTFYTDAGASASDNADSTVTVITTGSVDANTPGTYTLTYSASDTSGNTAAPVTRTVVVADTIAPVITLLGSAEMDVLFNGTFTDPGSSVSDGFESGLTATVTGVVDTSVAGTYTLTYNVSDSAGNAATEVQRTVHVVDQDGPVITLNGDASINHEAGTLYSDAGANATDNVDTTVTVVTTGSVDVNTPDTYTLTYSATDSEGNPATPVTRTVMVADTIAPVIALLGSAEMDVLFNATFTDPGSSVSDGFESGLTATVTGIVDTSVAGTYTLTYNVSDSAGNAATEVKRMVIVVDTGSFQVGGSVLKQSSGSLIPMEGVSVSLLQDGESDTQLTDANGMYAMSINASSGLKLTAQKPHEPGQASRGVDVLDIVAIRKHILVRAPFTKSIEMVAADTNLDASVDVRDIVGMRKVILVRTDAFLEDANGEKVSFWRFVASDFQSVDASQAFAEVDAAQSIDYPSINANINDALFLAVKLGDVNDDWSAPTSSSTQNVYVGGRRPQTERFALGAPREMEDGKVALALHANPLHGLLALQLDLNWDPEVLALDEIHGHALTGFDARIHTGHIKGSTRIAWDDATLEGVDLDKDQPIIQLIFSRQGSEKRGSPIHVKDLILQDDGGAYREEQATLGYYHPEGNIPLKGQGLMRSMRLEDGNLHLEFETRPGQSYAIETKQSLAKGDWQTWKVVEASGQSHSFQVPAYKGLGRYFRVRSSNWSKGLKSSLK